MSDVRRPRVSAAQAARLHELADQLDEPDDNRGFAKSLDVVLAYLEDHDIDNDDHNSREEAVPEFGGDRASGVLAGVRLEDDGEDSNGYDDVQRPERSGFMRDV